MIHANDVHKAACEVFKESISHISEQNMVKLNKLFEENYYLFKDYTCIFLDHSNIDPDLYDGDYYPCGNNNIKFYIDNNTDVSQYFKSYGYFVETISEWDCGFLISTYPITDDNRVTHHTFTPHNKR